MRQLHLAVVASAAALLVGLLCFAVYSDPISNDPGGQEPGRNSAPAPTAPDKSAAAGNDQENHTSSETQQFVSDTLGNIDYDDSEALGEAIERVNARLNALKNREDAGEQVRELARLRAKLQIARRDIGFVPRSEVGPPPPIELELQFPFADSLDNRETADDEGKSFPRPWIEPASFPIILACVVRCEDDQTFEQLRRDPGRVLRAVDVHVSRIDEERTLVDPVIHFAQFYQSREEANTYIAEYAIDLSDRREAAYAISGGIRGSIVTWLFPSRVEPVADIIAVSSVQFSVRELSTSAERYRASYVRGIGLMNREDYVGAEQALLEALSIEPARLQAMGALVGLYELRGEFKKALDVSRTIVELLRTADYVGADDVTVAEREELIRKRLNRNAILEQRVSAAEKQ